MTQEVSKEEIAAVIQKAFGNIIGANLIAQGLAQAIHDAGFKVVRRTSTEMREEIRKR